MSNDYLENIPFDELKIGDSITFTRTVSSDDVKLFAYLSGDNNPLHLDEEYAKTTQFGAPIAHGMFTALLVTAAVATRLPGPGSIYAGQEMKFKKPVYIGDTITAELEITDKRTRGNIVKIACEMKNQKGERVFIGVSTAIAPTEKIRVAASPFPTVTIE